MHHQGADAAARDSTQARCVVKVERGWRRAHIDRLAQLRRHLGVVLHLHTQRHGRRRGRSQPQRAQRREIRVARQCQPERRVRISLAHLHTPIAPLVHPIVVGRSRDRHTRACVHPERRPPRHTVQVHRERLSRYVTPTVIDDRDAHRALRFLTREHKRTRL